MQLFHVFFFFFSFFLSPACCRLDTVLTIGTIFLERKLHKIQLREFYTRCALAENVFSCNKTNGKKGHKSSYCVYKERVDLALVASLALTGIC